MKSKKEIKKVLDELDGGNDPEVRAYTDALRWVLDIEVN